MNRKLAIALLFVALVMTGCGAGAPGAGEPPPGNGEPPPTGGEPFAGRIIADGTSSIHTLNLPGGSWTQRLSNTVYDAVALHLPANALAVGGVSFGSPLTVEIHDLNNFARTGGFVWPQSADSDVGRIHALAISPDGQYAAAYLEGLGPTFLEIIDIAEREIIYSRQLTLASEGDLLWLDAERLVLVLELNPDPPSPELAGAIAAVSLDELTSGEDVIDIEPLVTFNEEQWAFGIPNNIAISHDSSQIAFSHSGDIWAGAIGATPHQLTTGPTSLTGPAFSPDGSFIAFTEFHSYASNPTFVIPNHRDIPYFVAGNGPETEAYLLEESTLVDRMLVWLP